MVEAAAVLLEAGANIEAHCHSVENWTPLFFACEVLHMQGAWHGGWGQWCVTITSLPHTLSHCGMQNPAIDAFGAVGWLSIQLSMGCVGVYNGMGA